MGQNAIVINLECKKLEGSLKQPFRISKSFSLQGCIFCEKEVENEHKAIECEKCEKGQHIRCDKVMNG